MASARLSGIALATLAQVALEKGFNSFMEHLSRDESSISSGEEDKLQQPEKVLKTLADAHQKLEREVKRLHKGDKQKLWLILSKIRDVNFDIQDLVADLEVMELQRKVQEISHLHDEADKCQLLYLFGWTTGEPSQKRRRLSSLKLPTDEIVNKTKTIINQINSIYSEMKAEIKLDPLFNEITLNDGVCDSCGQHHVAKNKRVTTSSPNERILYGRDNEFKQLKKLLLKKPDVNASVSVVPIAGMGGIGKTALAQLVFNNTKINKHFEKKAWICVSDPFDRFRITKDILHSISIGDSNSPTIPYGSITSLDVLEREIKWRLTGKKFLVVLDDVWSKEWQRLFNFLQSTQAKVIKLIVTCRNPKILGVLADGGNQNNQIILRGLSDEDYWLLFKKCAFAEKNPDDYLQLHEIGKQIMGKLKGSPSAANTVGGLLRSQLTEKRWKHILENDLWKLETDANDIMPMLALSYYHLSLHLRPCFTFCSVFPKDFEYDMNSVIGMWIAHGYVQESKGSSQTLEDIGEEYWHELEAMCFFEKGVLHGGLKMHGLFHDLAQFISHGEIYIYKGRKHEEISEDVRHLCAHSWFDPESVCKTNNLRTLVLYRAGRVCASLKHRAFKRIRVLVVLDSDMQDFPDTVFDLKYLQYLDLQRTNIKSIPESLYGLYRLKVLKLPHLHIVPSLFLNLITLQEWGLFQDTEKFSYQHCLAYHVKREEGHHIAQMRNMNEVRGALLIEGLENINTMEAAIEVKLKEKQHVKRLDLRWADPGEGCKHDVQEQVLEALQPHPNLNYLFIQGYMGSNSPSWLMTLQKLRTIKLKECRKWASLPSALGLLPSLEQLCLIDIENIIIEGDDTMIEMFPSLQILALEKTIVSFQGMSSSSLPSPPPPPPPPPSSSSSPPPSSSSSSSSPPSSSCRKLFPRLQNLRVEECDEVNGLPWQMLSALENLTINASRGLQGQVPECLQNLNSLTSLEIKGLKIEGTNIESQQQLECLVPNLREIKIECCENMAFLQAVLLHVPSLGRLTISKCGPVTLPALEVLAYISLEEVKVTVEGVFPSLHTLVLKKASMTFPNMASSSSSRVTKQSNNCFPCLKTLRIEGCDVVQGLYWPMLSAPTHLYIINSPGMDAQLPGCLRDRSTLVSLELTGVKIKSFPQDVMTTLPALEQLRLEDCNELMSVEGLQALPSLKYLSISKCHQFRTWFMEQIAELGVLLPNLLVISIDSCENLESLPAWLPHLPSLTSLSIIKCPKLHSLPEGGLPSSLQILKIKECDPSLMERCQQESAKSYLLIG